MRHLPLPPTLTIHRSMPIKQALKIPLRRLDGLMQDDNGRKLSGKEIRAKMQEWANDGCERIQIDPDCVTHDKVNGCMGCPGNGVGFMLLPEPTRDGEK